MKALVKKVMDNLSSKGLIFCSEADFQFSFAQELKCIEPRADIFLEKCVLVEGEPYYVDLIYYLDGLCYYVEFKYQTSQCTKICGKFEISIKNQMAEDIMRYDYLFDIKRIENISKEHSADFGGGCAIILTNDTLIFSEPTRYSKTVLDYNFRIHERTEEGNTYPIPGYVSWNNADKSDDHWTKKGQRKDPFDISVITTQWQKYLQFKDKNNVPQDFRYLVNYVKTETK